MFNDSQPRGNDPRGGFTLLELMVSIGLLMVAVMAVGAMVMPTSRSREQLAAKNRVLARATDLLEEMKAVAPEAIFAAYDSTTYNVGDVDGTFANGDAVSCSVDNVTDPKLLGVTLTGSFNLVDHTETIVLWTVIHYPGG